MGKEKLSFSKILPRLRIPSFTLPEDSDLCEAADRRQGCWLEKPLAQSGCRGRLVGCYREDHPNPYTGKTLPATIYIEIRQSAGEVQLERYLQLPTQQHVPRDLHTSHKSYDDARLSALRWLAQAREQMRRAEERNAAFQKRCPASSSARVRPQNSLAAPLR